MMSRVWLGFLAIAIALVAVAAYAGEAARQQKSTQGWVTPAVRAPGLEQRVFSSTVAKTTVSYHLYTPDLYKTDKERRFPVIYWLHGWEGGGKKQLSALVEHFDRAMREGKMPPALVVFPNGMAESMWVNSKDGRVPMETVVVQEVVPNVDATYRTIAARSGRLIEGFSMGGYGAGRLGFKYPDLFGSVSMLGAGPVQREFVPGASHSEMDLARSRILENVYGNDQAYFLAQSPWVLAERNAAVLRSQTHLRIAVGSQDGMRPANEDLASHLSQLRIPHEFRVVANVGHAPFPLLRALGDANWDFYRAALGDEVRRDPAGSTGAAEPKSTLEKGEPAGSGDDRHRRIVERLHSFDYDGDGVINLRDLPPPAQARFQRLDSNGDGQLDVNELSKLTRRPAR